MDSITPQLQSGIAAIRVGQYEQARTALIDVLKAEPRNETAWLWLSRAMPTLEQALRCIEHLLTISPHNTHALEAREVLQVRLVLEEAAVVQTDTTPLSTPQRRYLLGEALVEAGVLTESQLAAALKEQVRLAAKGKPMRLGEILLRLKYIRPEQLEGAVAAQVATLPTTSAPNAPGQIGAHLIRRGLLTPAQLHQGLAQQAALKRQGQPVLLGDVLVRCGYLSREQLNHAMLEWQQQYEMSFV